MSPSPASARLHAQDLPREGGDTSFASMYAAYAALPAEIKRRIEGKRAIHSYRKTYDVIQGSTWRRAAERDAER